MLWACSVALHQRVYHPCSGMLVRMGQLHGAVAVSVIHIGLLRAMITGAGDVRRAAKFIRAYLHGVGEIAGWRCCVDAICRKLHGT